jgi:fatty-acyl-CoA synthase
MFTRHYAYWPPERPKSLSLPATSVYANLEASARRNPEHCAIDYYGGRMSYGELKHQVDALAGFLHARLGIERGDRVLLYTQNSPQYVIGYYAILCAGAVVVPVNPMNRTEELRHYIEDAGARAMIATQELWGEIAPLLGTSTLRHVVLGTYSDYVSDPGGLPVPDIVLAPRQAIGAPGVIGFAEAIAAGLEPPEHRARSHDLCVMPYTSGTTGKPKGCMHTHRSVQATTTSIALWRGDTHESVVLGVLPMFHVTGMQSGMNAPVRLGSTIVLMTRWDRDCAARQVERTRVTTLTAITTMMVDFLANPALDRYDLSSLSWVGGGGAAMPEAVAGLLEARIGLPYIEGYGLSETMAPTHFNPNQRPKRQCAGIPMFDVDARVLDPETRAELRPLEIGEIVLHGPQLFEGYWQNPAATEEAFLEHDGKRFFRSGDLGYYDEDGYFFVTDRLKRMINAAGFKVWPAEVEALLYAHPDIQEACVIASRDPYRGETVKAVVVARPEASGRLRGEDITAWARSRMAAYKVPRVVELVAELPKTATGKILWRELQEEENRRTASAG